MIVENGMRVMMTVVVALLVGRLVSKMKLMNRWRECLNAWPA